MDNHGGRVNYVVGERVIILNPDGTLSNEIYSIAESRSDRRGSVGLIHPITKTVVRVHNRRIMPPEVADKIVVIEVADKYYALCGKCGHRESYADGQPEYACPKCLHKSDYHWLSERPLTQISKPAPKRNKKVAIKVNMDELINLPDCELWSKKMIFDHPEIDARTNVLVCLVGTPRKLVFNTYDGKLGKKANALPLDDFLAAVGTGWYKVNPTTYQRDLQNGGYSRQD